MNDKLESMAKKMQSKEYKLLEKAKKEIEQLDDMVFCHLNNLVEDSEEIGDKVLFDVINHATEPLLKKMNKLMKKARYEILFYQMHLLTEIYGKDFDVARSRSVSVFHNPINCKNCIKNGDADFNTLIDFINEHKKEY